MSDGEQVTDESFEQRLSELRAQRVGRERDRVLAERTEAALRAQALRERAEAKRNELRTVSAIARESLYPLLETVNRVYLRDTGTIVMRPGLLKLRFRELTGKRIPRVLLMLIWGTQTDQEAKRVTGYKLVLELQSSRSLRIEGRAVDLSKDDWRTTVEERICRLLSRPKSCYVEQDLE